MTFGFHVSFVAVVFLVVFYVAVSFHHLVVVVICSGWLLNFVSKNARLPGFLDIHHLLFCMYAALPVVSCFMASPVGKTTAKSRRAQGRDAMARN